MIEKNKLRAIRIARMMTQEDVADLTKVALRTIHAIEKGQRCLQSTKRKILIGLGIPFEEKGSVWPEQDERSA